MSALRGLFVTDVLVVVASACQPAGPAALTQADQAAIRAVAESALAIANTTPKDFKRYTEIYYAENAEVLGANSPAVKGRAAIEQFLAAFPPFSDLKFDLTEIDGRGDLAYVRGTYSMKLMPPGATAPVDEHGKYLEVWRKQSDGSWRSVYDAFNSDVPLPAPEPAAKE